MLNVGLIQCNCYNCDMFITAQVKYINKSWVSNWFMPFNPQMHQGLSWSVKFLTLHLTHNKISPRRGRTLFCLFNGISVKVLTAKDITRLIMPSLSSPCLPLRLNHSSITLPSLRLSGMVTWVHAILSSMENALWMEHQQKHMIAYLLWRARRKKKQQKKFSGGRCSVNSCMLEFMTILTPWGACSLNLNAVSSGQAMVLIVHVV